ncbi:ABC transporter ATP-binding protein [Helicobacter pylori]|nr:ABC transporter ATP-binding protein [Helicobacter pylori]UOR23003.1 ABC transporter ATP-binding protein [Helicobacter pylori]
MGAILSILKLEIKAQYKPLNSILKSVTKTFDIKERLSAKDLLALLKDI